MPDGGGEYGVQCFRHGVETRVETLTQGQLHPVTVLATQYPVLGTGIRIDHQAIGPGRHGRRIAHGPRPAQWEVDRRDQPQTEHPAPVTDDALHGGTPGMIDDVGDTPGLPHQAGFQDDEPVGDPGGRRRVTHGDQPRGAPLITQVLDEVGQLPRLVIGKPLEGIIDDGELGLAGDGSGQVDADALGLVEFSWSAGRYGPRQPDGFQGFVGSGAGGVLGPVEQLWDGADVVEHAARGEESFRPTGPADTASQIRLLVRRQWAIVEVDFPRGRVNQAVGHGEHCGFACPGGADDDGHCAGGHRERDISQNGSAAYLMSDLVELEHHGLADMWGSVVLTLVGDAGGPRPISRVSRTCDTGQVTRGRLTWMAVVLLAALCLTPSPAHADTGYRFWNEFLWEDGQWVVGTDDSRSVPVTDGRVYGWRFATVVGTARAPRAAGDFTIICGDVPAESGMVRVAVVIDPGTEDGPTTPTGTCVVTSPSTSVRQALGAVAPLRMADGLVCSIDGYPADECGREVNSERDPGVDEPVDLEVTEPVGSRLWTPRPRATATPAPTPPPTTEPPPTVSSSQWLMLGGGALVVLVLGTGVVLEVRRKSHRLPPET